MIPAVGLSDEAMIQAASRRATVRLQRGNIGQLLGWKVRGGSDRARVQLGSGVVITVRCSEVVSLEAPEPIAPVSEIAPENIHLSC